MPTPVQKHADSVLADFPKSELWRLFIDGFRQDEGKFAFDKGFDAQDGYYASMEAAWEKMINEIDTPLTVESFIALHADSTCKLTSRSAELNEMRTGDKINSFGVLSKDNPYDSKAWNCTKEGLAEFVKYRMKEAEKLKRSDQRYDFEAKIPNPNKNSKRLQILEFDILESRNNESVESIANYLNSLAIKGDLSFSARGDAKKGAEEIIKEYQSAIKYSFTEESKLKAIAQCITKLERLHAFEDANCRTMLLLMNKLLLQNKLSPVILENPNRIEMLSTHELVQEIKNGQARYKASCTTDIVAFIKNTSIKSTTPEYKQKLIAKLSGDPLEAMSQLHEIYTKLSKEHMGAKPILQEIYAQKFEEACRKLDEFERINPEYQEKHQQYNNITGRELTDDERTENDKYTKLATRTTSSIEWMKGRMAEMAVKHQEINVPIRTKLEERSSATTAKPLGISSTADPLEPLAIKALNPPMLFSSSAATPAKIKTPEIMPDEPRMKENKRP